ncbi:MAG: prenyltransferase/squalene oxidase repeat-containing protein [Candidatus Bathyarchaeia archaeon]|nr:terpene cyclase/mutase family protein [Candidatus Bathyarchaeota archaeon A05DMB-4]MDH7595986.1 terpene cyclase/mutase family protein [Candidatus Bathyarchaeota archaeon]
MKKLRGFIRSLQDESGGIATSLGEESDPNNGWLIRHLLELGMKREALRFRDYLLEHQNTDGGWGQNGKAPSMISLTANALSGLCDAGVSARHASVTKAIEFLLAHQEKESGFSETVDTGVPWMKPGVVWGWITAVAVEALYKAGVRITTPAFDDAALFVRKCFWENREGIEGQSVMVRALRNTRFAVMIETKEMKRRIDCAEQAENGGFPRENPNLDTTLNILGFLYDIGVREDDARFSKAVHFVVSSRNEDGGWPATPGEKSVLWASLESAVLLKNLGKLV